MLTEDPERKVVVVSAPGKRFSNDTKVTDLLIALAEQALSKADTDQSLKAVMDRYESLAKDLSLSPNIIDTIQKDLFRRLNTDLDNPEQFMDLLKASGEDNNAKLVADYFQSQGVEAHYIDPKEAGLVVTNEPGNAEVVEASYQRLFKLRERSAPGFSPVSSAVTRTGMLLLFPGADRILLVRS